jgi:hypothetical protein
MGLQPACHTAAAPTSVGVAGSSAAGGAGGESGHAATPEGGLAEQAGAQGVDAGQAGAWDPAHPPPCTISAPTSCPDDWPVYADVEPVLGERCLSCHEGRQGGPWPLTTYAHVASWRDEIRAALLTCAMPPPDQAPPLPRSESLLLLTWIRCGMPP